MRITNVIQCLTLVICIDETAASTVNLNDYIAVLTVPQPAAYYRTYAIELPSSLLQFGDMCNSSVSFVISGI